MYGYPDADAAQVSVAALRSTTTRVTSIVLVAFHRRTAELWRAALGE